MPRRRPLGRHSMVTRAVTRRARLPVARLVAVGLFVLTFAATVVGVNMRAEVDSGRSTDESTAGTTTRSGAPMASEPISRSGRLVGARPPAEDDLTTAHDNTTHPPARPTVTGGTGTGTASERPGTATSEPEPTAVPSRSRDGRDGRYRRDRDCRDIRDDRRRRECYDRRDAHR